MKLKHLTADSLFDDWVWNGRSLLYEWVLVHVCINIAHKIGIFEEIFRVVLRRCIGWESKDERQKSKIC